MVGGGHGSQACERALLFCGWETFFSSPFWWGTVVVPLCLAAVVCLAIAVTKTQRRCRDCGRIVPDGASLCPACLSTNVHIERRPAAAPSLVRWGISLLVLGGSAAALGTAAAYA